MPIDQPPAADGPENQKALPDRPGHQNELKQGLGRLRPGHPSSPVEADGTPKPPEPGLRCRESPDATPPDDADWRPLTDAEYAEHVTNVTEQLDKAHVDGLAEQQHTTDPDHEQWAEDRAVMQDAIIADLYEAARDVPCEWRAILAGGRSGAGKTTVLDQYAGIDRSQYLTINPDVMKEEMAKRGMIPEIAGLSPMEASDLVHEESSHIAKQLALRAMREGKNIIWDITMASQESTEKRIREIRAAGYPRVEGIFVDIPEDVAIRRSNARHREGHDNYRAEHGLGGRLIPAELIRSQADPEWGSSNRKAFEQVKPELDPWLLFDNSVDGRAPVLLDSGGREEDKR